MRIISFNTKEITLTLIGFFIILATDSFVVFANENQNFMRLSQSIIIISLFLMILNHIKLYSTIDKSFIRLTFVCAFLFLGMLKTADFTGGYFLKLVLLLFGYFFCKFVSLDTFVKIYIRCMKYITIFSLIVYLLNDLIVKLPFLPIVSNGGVNLYFVGLTNIYLGSQFGIVRNWGPFWEPGVFQVYLIIALMLVMFYNKKIHKYETILFTLGIITTFSTAGFISLAIIYLAYMASKNRGKQPFKIVLGIGLIILVLIIYFTPDLYQLLFAKFDKSSGTSESFISRWYSVWGNINTFLKSPLYGVGPNNVNVYLNEYLLSKGIYHVFSNTNAIFMNYSMFGGVIGTFFIFKVYSFVRVFNVKWLIRLLLFLVFLLCLSVEPLVYSLMFHVLIFYGTKSNTRNL